MTEPANGFQEQLERGGVLNDEQYREVFPRNYYEWFHGELSDRRRVAEAARQYPLGHRYSMQRVQAATDGRIVDSDPRLDLTKHAG